MNLDVSREVNKKNILFRNATPLSSKQNKLLNILCYTVVSITVFSMLGIILYYVYAFAASSLGSNRFDWLLGIFSDFVEIMNASLKYSPYLTDATSYPPLAVAVLYPFAMICRGVFSKYWGMTGLTVDELTARVVLHPEFWIAIVLFFLISIAAIWLIVIRKYRLEPVAAFKVGLLLMFSAPCVYAIMRGNTIYFALIFSMLFLLLYDHPKAWVREIAYICLVIAGCIKIYPLFLGVFVLKKKRFFAVVRTGIYFFAVFLLSFFIFQSGFEGMTPFLSNLGDFASDGDRLLSLRNLSLSSLVFKAAYALSPTVANSDGFSAFSLYLILFTMVVATITATLTKSDFSRLVIATGVIILIPTVSYFYVLVFTFLPLMEFIRHFDEFSKWKRSLYTMFYLFLYSCCFLLTQCFIFQAVVIIIMLVLEEIAIVHQEFFPWLKAQKAKKKSA